jgi:hypothetical protein
LIRTDMPDGSFSRIEFSPWFVRSYDQNDTLADGNPWYDARKILPAGDPDQRAAELAKTICGDTPAETISTASAAMSSRSRTIEPVRSTAPATSR